MKLFFLKKRLRKGKNSKQIKQIKKTKVIRYVSAANIILSYGFNAKGIDEDLLKVASENCSAEQLEYIKCVNKLFDNLCQKIKLRFNPCDRNIDHLQKHLDEIDFPTIMLPLIQLRDKYFNKTSDFEVNLSCKEKSEMISIIDKIVQEDNNKSDNARYCIGLLNKYKQKIYSQMFIGNQCNLYAHRELSLQYNDLINKTTCVQHLTKHLLQLRSLASSGILSSKEYGIEVQKAITKAQKAAKQEKPLILRGGMIKKIEKMKNIYCKFDDSDKENRSIASNKRVGKL